LHDPLISSIIFPPVATDLLMDITFFFALLGGLLVLAFFANRVVRFTRVPDVIILMATGVVRPGRYHTGAKLAPFGAAKRRNRAGPRDLAGRAQPQH
jgi:hypothetical protein